MNRLIQQDRENPEHRLEILDSIFFGDEPIGKSYNVHKINRIEFKCKPIIFNDDWKEQLAYINTEEELKDFISNNISITFNLKGKKAEQLIFLEDENVLNGNKKVTIKGKHMDIVDNFSWGT
jgi:hypothetical protein